MRKSNFAMLIAVPVFLFLGWRLTAQQSKPAKSAVEYSDIHVKVIAVYDDSCTMYVTEPNSDTLSDKPPAPVVLGRGCK
jgi:hypothetical protein